MMKFDFNSLQTTVPIFGDSSEFPGEFSTALSFKVPITDDVSSDVLFML
jgi:hypothetical protein